MLSPLPPSPPCTWPNRLCLLHRTEAKPHLHWRYPYDPPEFMTLLVGKDRHWGYFRCPHPRLPRPDCGPGPGPTVLQDPACHARAPWHCVWGRSDGDRSRGRETCIRGPNTVLFPQDPLWFAIHAFPLGAVRGRFWPVRPRFGGGQSGAENREFLRLPLGEANPRASGEGRRRSRRGEIFASVTCLPVACCLLLVLVMGRGV